MMININRDELTKKKGKLPISEDICEFVLQSKNKQQLEMILVESSIQKLRESSNELSLSNIKENEK